MNTMAGTWAAKNKPGIELYNQNSYSLTLEQASSLVAPADIMYHPGQSWTPPEKSLHG